MKKKLLALILSVAVVASIAAAGTLAYLTAQTENVVNTFSVGDITLDLKEHELKADGTLDLTKEVVKNQYDRILPGQTLPKDPFVTVEKGSEDCYLYVAIVNGLNDAVDAAKPLPEGEFAAQLIRTSPEASKWELVAAEGNTVIVRYENVVSYDATKDQEFTVFDQVAINGKLDNTQLAALQDAQIIVSAYAHQSANVEQTVADAAAVAHFLPGNPEVY